LAARIIPGGDIDKRCQEGLGDTLGKRYAGRMKRAKVKFRCDKTGLVYEWKDFRFRPESMKEINEHKMELHCEACGGKHVAFVEEERSKS
jgi:Zn finger protein HypA/HybF involved in hydrogenase expression